MADTGESAAAFCSIWPLWCICLDAHLPAQDKKTEILPCAVISARTFNNNHLPVEVIFPGSAQSASDTDRDLSAFF